jgi:hypothetical protein
MRATKIHTGGTREHGRTGTNQLRRSQLKGIGSEIRHAASSGRATLSGDARLEEKQLKDKAISFLERQRMMDPSTWCVNYEEEGEGAGAGEEQQEGGAEAAEAEAAEAEAEAEGEGGEQPGEGGTAAPPAAGGGSSAAAGGGVTTSQGVRSTVSGAALQQLLSKAKASNNLSLGKRVLVSVSSEAAVQ